MGIFDIAGSVIGYGLDRKKESRVAARDRQASTTAYERSKEFAQNQIQWRTDDAQAAGIHPLFAMGASTQSFQPGNSGGGYQETGSSAGNAIRRIGGNLDKIREDFLKAQINNTKAKTAQILANANQDNIIDPAYHPQVQSVKKGQVDPYYQNKPERNLTVKSPMTTFRIGDQKIWMPVEETDQVMEDPAMIAIATYFYEGNKNVNWRKALRQYTGTPLGHSLAQRNPRAMAAGAKFAQKIKQLSSGKPNIQNTFFKRKSRQRRGY